MRFDALTHSHGIGTPPAGAAKAASTERGTAWVHAGAGRVCEPNARRNVGVDERDGIDEGGACDNTRRDRAGLALERVDRIADRELGLDERSARRTARRWPACVGRDRPRRNAGPLVGRHGAGMPRRNHGDRRRAAVATCEGGTGDPPAGTRPVTGTLRDAMKAREAPFVTLTRRERASLRSLLIRATAGAAQSPDIGELERLVAAAPVDLLPAAAVLHRVAGSVLRGLTGVDGVPDGVRAQLGAVRQQSALHHLLVSGGLGKIGDAFDGAGIRWVAMKGPVVAALLYPEVGDRTYADLDLLVHRHDFPVAVRVLEELGYGHVIRNWALAEDMLAGQLPMGGPSFDVDLHWHLHYSREDRRPFGILPEEMIERARPVSVSGVRAPALDPVDTLLTLAFHAARSDGHRLIWLKDVERSVAVERPDLDELVRRCRAYDCGPPVGLILRRSRSLLDAEIPDDTLRALMPTTLRAAEDLVLAAGHPVQLHDRPTVARAFTRSARSSALASVSELPARGARRFRRRFLPPPADESANPADKASYLRAVSASTDP